MCGIAGLLVCAQGGTLPDLRGRLDAMARAERHRGPDDEGMYIAPGGRAGIANRRLAIRDLSPAGHMPMGNAEGTVWITYNGEIYNTDELRAQLERLGYGFRSTSDTEVILHGYDAWGESVVERLRGIFAFAVLDGRDSSSSPRLFLARDRLGVKPLYFARTPEVFVFASELKALHASGLTSREISPAGLVGYLLLGSVPVPLTIYRDAHALDAGCTLTVQPDLVTAASEPVRYWWLPAVVEEPRSDMEAVEQVSCLLQESVQTELVSDVPLGAFLSGGLDSSAVVALMRRTHNGAIRTCSMAFEEAAYDEALYARAMAEAAGAEHYERVITARDLTQHMDHILSAMDQPTVDSVNTYFVSQTAREAGLTVALSGLGGDELFGGYTNTFKGVPQMLRALSLVQALPTGPGLAARATTMLPRRRRLAKLRAALGRPASRASAYFARRGLFAPDEVRALVSADIWAEAAKNFDPIPYLVARSALNGRASAEDLDLFGWISRAELSTYTQSQLLRDTDVMSMAHSLEVRVPLLDHRLVEAVVALPARLKQAGGGPKPLLRTALDGALPPLIREREGKQGFVFPLDRWMRGPLRGTVELLLSNAVASGWLRPDAVRDVWGSYESGKLHWSRAWSLAVLGSNHILGGAGPVQAQG